MKNNIDKFKLKYLIGDQVYDTISSIEKTTNRTLAEYELKMIYCKVEELMYELEEHWHDYEEEVGMNSEFFDDMVLKDYRRELMGLVK